VVVGVPHALGDVADIGGTPSEDLLRESVDEALQFCLTPDGERWKKQTRTLVTSDVQGLSEDRTRHFE